jgi:hypothetical protein
MDGFDKDLDDRGNWSFDLNLKIVFAPKEN